MKNKKIFILFLLLISIFFTGCSALSLNGKEYVTVEYYHGETIVHVKKIEKGKEILLSPFIPQEGYDFEGWYLDSDFKENIELPLEVNKNLKIYGKYSFSNEIGKVEVVFYNGFLEAGKIEVEKGSTIEPIEVSRYGHIFSHWCTDEALKEPFDFATAVNENLALYAKFNEVQAIISFDTNGGEEITPILVDKKAPLPNLEEAKKEHYLFNGWYYDIDLTEPVDYTEKVYYDMTLYASWRMNPEDFYKVTYNLGDSAWNNKTELRKAFYGDFYEFLKTNTPVDFESLNIKNFEDFDNFCLNWNALGRSDLYGVGDAFASYFIKQDIGGSIAEQPETTFLGYCYKNGKYVHFIPFLERFFAYWRTGEGYTGGPSDPDNLGNDFYASPWASLVDTAKFFYFTGDTLNTKYPWFNSGIVKWYLDNIIGVLNTESEGYGLKGTSFVLPPDVKNPGYRFLGWYLTSDYSGERVTQVDSETTVYALFE